MRQYIWKDIKYDELDKYFTAPKSLSPFYSNNRIPRKLKKKVKISCGIFWVLTNNAERLWYHLDYVNKNYKRFLIKQLCNENT